MKSQNILEPTSQSVLIDNDYHSLGQGRTSPGASITKQKKELSGLHTLNIIQPEIDPRLIQYLKGVNQDL